MRAYLLEWNPKKYSELYDDYKGWQDGTWRGDWWRTTSTKVFSNARVFLMRLGEEPKGIIAVGKTLSPTYEREDPDEPGKMIDVADVEFSQFSHPDEPLVSLDRLLQIKNDMQGLWTHNSSGRRIPDDVADELDRVWQEAATRAGLSTPPPAQETPELKRIRNLDDLSENFATFQREARFNRQRSASILRQTKYWVRDENSGAFGPGKFLGFRGMNFPLYEHAKKGRTKGYDFQGKITREAIEKVLGEKFKPNDDLIAECRLWGENYFGREAFGGATGSKWKFIRYAIPGREATSPYPDEVTQPEGLTEGGLRTVTVNAYERNPEARRRCVEFYKPICKVCRLDFVERYGEIGRDFIHVHHLKPIAKIGKKYEIDPINDLRPVCPNCHAMLHRKDPPLSIEQLKSALRD